VISILSSARMRAAYDVARSAEAYRVSVSSKSFTLPAGSAVVIGPSVGQSSFKQAKFGAQNDEPQTQRFAGSY
jgi:hypothetical protein